MLSACAHLRAPSGTQTRVGGGPVLLPPAPRPREDVVKPMSGEPALRNRGGEFAPTEEVAERDAYILWLLAQGLSY